MNSILLVLSIAWIIFVLRSLIKGSNIEYPTNNTRIVYWTLMGLCFAYGIYYLVKLSLLSIIWMALMVLSCILYACIPSGFDSKGIYLKGTFYPYKKIQNLKGEYAGNKYRVNFMSKNIQMFIEVDEEKDDILRLCERYYKEAIRND